MNGDVKWQQYIWKKIQNETGVMIYHQAKQRIV